MATPKFIPNKIAETSLPATSTDGNVFFTDQGSILVAKTDGTLIRMTDFVICSSLPVSNQNKNKAYLLTTNKTINFWNTTTSSWDSYGGGYTLPISNSTTLGGVKAGGNGINVDTTGIVSTKLGTGLKYDVSNNVTIDPSNIDVTQLKSFSAISTGVPSGFFDNTATISFFNNAAKGNFYIYNGSTTFTIGGITVKNSGDQIWCISSVATPANLTTNFVYVPTVVATGKVTITQPANSATVTIADGKTVLVDNSIEFIGTDSTKITMPSTTTNVLGNNVGITGGTTVIGDTVASGNLTLKSTSNATQGNIVLSSNTIPNATNSINLGSATVSYANTYTRNVNSDYTLNIGSAATEPITITSGTTGAINIDSGTTGNVNIANSANAKTVNIGNNTGATAVNITSGTGGISLTTGTTGAISIDSGTTGNVNIGTNTNAKTVTIGNSTGASTVNINAGTGKINAGSELVLSQSSTTMASLNIPHSAVTPTTPNTDDIYKNSYNELIVYHNNVENRIVTESVISISSQVTQTIQPCTMVDVCNIAAKNSVLTLASGTRTGQKITFLVSASNFSDTNYFTVYGNVNGMAGCSIINNKSFVSFYFLWSQSSSTWILCNTGSGY